MITFKTKAHCLCCKRKFVEGENARTIGDNGIAFPGCVTWYELVKQEIAESGSGLVCYKCCKEYNLFGLKQGD